MPATAREAQGRGPDIGIAPGHLGTLQAFVNTLDIEQGTDELASPADLDAWLRQTGLADGPADPSGPRELSAAIELREALREVLRSHVTPRSAAGNRRQPTDSATFNAGVGDRRAAVAAARVARVAAAMRAGIDVDPSGRVVVVPVGAGARAGLTRLLLIGAEAATAGTWTRLKVCSADDCQWAFYDRSPTHSGCWCSMQICGSRAKSRAYRSRAVRAG
jgi:predicted RNA-binding Zn ribbon-like protein